MVRLVPSQNVRSVNGVTAGVGFRVTCLGAELAQPLAVTEYVNVTTLPIWLGAGVNRPVGSTFMPDQLPPPGLLPDSCNEVSEPGAPKQSDMLFPADTLGLSTNLATALAVPVQPFNTLVAVTEYVPAVLGEIRSDVSPVFQR